MMKSNNGPTLAPMENGGQTAAFKKIVTKEPKYVSDCPFRGVFKLGSQEYAFALDAVPTKPEAKSKPRPRSRNQEKPKTGLATGKLAGKLLKATTPPETSAMMKAMTYNRLYFDFNHNGDLTDDEVVDSIAQRTSVSAIGAQQTYTSFQFPRIDVTIDDGGTKLDYSFFLRGYAMISPNFSYVSMSMNAAAYREGTITLEGKKRHIVLIDFNSNGRFDDEFKINKNVRASNGQMYPEHGDMLLIDPDPTNAVRGESPYDATTSNTRY